ncbi:MAG: T9SS type A sorting domain-containing protein [Candidatus Marinimicrobia bacterium]|nr:T9SS type A sorting domain-containing protein [Candidatus Neomarinimicrobiota bacterium]
MYEEVCYTFFYQHRHPDIRPERSGEGDTIISEDFSTGDNYTVTLGGEGSDGTSDYFMRTDGTDIGPSYTGADGYFFAGQDIDDGGWTGSASPSELTWSSIDISGYTSLSFSGDFASAAIDKIDAIDYVHVQYRIDSGSWTNLLWFKNDGTTHNTYFLEDTDFDGTGDGTQLSSTFATFSKSIAETGSTLDIRITVAVESGGEDIAFDNFVVAGTAPTGVDNPSDFTATATETDQIDLSWTLNGSSDDVMVVYDEDGSFTNPTNGDSYSVSSSACGGTVIYNGSGTLYNHSSLSANTTYYYKAWSVDASDNYSAGVTADATTEPIIPALMISEVADPRDDYSGRFVELYNASGSEIDFSSQTWYFDRQANGGNHSSIQLTGTLTTGGTYVIGNASNIDAVYGAGTTDLDFGSVTGNGDDGYFLFYDGDETTGTLYDAYGVIDIDGTGEDWEYEDSRAVRYGVTEGNPTWTASEWTIELADVADCTPGELDSDQALPISLAAFDAAYVNGAVKLSWQTASETENLAFRIYRDGEMLAELDGAGTTTEPQNYSYTDQYVIPGRTYTYVLVDVDLQGKETKHPEVEVKVEAEDGVDIGHTIGNAYPNPFNPQTIVPLNLATDADVQAALYDISGRMIRKLYNAPLSAGSHDLKIDGSDLSTGIYLLQVRMNDAVHVQKIALMK